MLHQVHTPGSVGLPRENAKVKHLQALVLDGARLHRFFVSVARSIALARAIKIVPMKAEAKDTLGVKAIIAVMPERFLSHDVELPDEKTLNAEAEEGAEEFGELFWEQLDTKGVEGAIAFLEDVEAQGENAKAKIQQVFREVSLRNQGAASSQETILHGLVLIKCASTIVVAGIALPIVTGGASLGLAGFGVGASYSIALGTIKEWDDASKADLVLVAGKDVGTDVAKDKVKDAAEAMSDIYGKEGANAGTAARKMAWLTKRLNSAAPEEKARLLRRIARAQDAEEVAQNAQRLSKGLKAVPYLFFVWSTYDALKTAHDEW